MTQSSQSLHHSLILRSVKKKKRITMMIPGAMVTGLMSPCPESSANGNAALHRRRSHHPLSSKASQSILSKPADVLSKQLFATGENQSTQEQSDDNECNAKSDTMVCKQLISHFCLQICFMYSFL